MTYAYFSGCKIPFFCPQYGDSTKAVLSALGIRFVEPEFNCCGYPIRHFDFNAYLLQSARNLALAEALRLDILTPCKCCYGSLMHARHFLEEHPETKSEINRLLQEDGLCYRGGVQVRHLLSVLADDVGADRIAASVKRPCTGLRVAAHYGCHALRPSAVVEFDHPFSPTIFENLIRATGAETLDWAKRLECCGQPLAEKNPVLSEKLTAGKMTSAVAAGADMVCTACTYCQIQFESISEKPLPSILFPQLLGASLGLAEKKLGLNADPANRKLLKQFRVA